MEVQFYYLETPSLIKKYTVFNLIEAFKIFDFKQMMQK